MTRLAIWPFYSQQDKVTGEFLLNTCGASKQMSWLAKRVEQELGWHAYAAVPIDTSHVYPFRNYRRVHMVPNNVEEQVRWDTGQLRNFFAGADIALLNHELLAVPVRRLFPQLKVVQMCSVRPTDEDLFKAAWHKADLVVAQGPVMARYIQNRTRTPVTVWPMAFDADEDVIVAPDRDIDVLFVARCSVTNHTHHLEFLQALPALKGLRVAFTDVTGYLRKSCPEFEYSTPATYRQYLARSKVAVALQDNLHGGLAVREACRYGCTPVVLACPEYKALVGWDYPYQTTLNPDCIAETVKRALADPRKVDVSRESYQASWLQVKEDLLCLSR